MLASNTRKAIVLAVGLLLPAAFAGIAEYTMTGGKSTWIPMLSGLLGSVVAWPLLWWFAIRPSSEWVELFSTIITLEKRDGRTRSVAVKPFRPALVRELKVELTASDVEQAPVHLMGDATIHSLGRLRLTSQDSESLDKLPPMSYLRIGMSRSGNPSLSIAGARRSGDGFSSTDGDSKFDEGIDMVFFKHPRKAGTVDRVACVGYAFGRRLYRACLKVSVR